MWTSLGRHCRTIESRAPVRQRLIYPLQASDRNVLGTWRTSVTRRTLAVPGGPKDTKLKIPANVFVFGLLLIPTLIISATMGQFDVDESAQAELKEEIREKYGNRAASMGAQQRNEAMAEFYSTVIKKRPNETDDDDEVGSEKDKISDKAIGKRNEDRLQEVLHGGKYTKKRFYAVDRDLYGTQEGVQEKERLQDDLEEKAEQRQKRRTLWKKENASSTKDSGMAGSAPPQSSMIGLNVDKAQVVTVAVVGTIAAAVGFLLGGSRRN